MHHSHLGPATHHSLSAAGRSARGAQRAPLTRRALHYTCWVGRTRLSSRRMDDALGHVGAHTPALATPATRPTWLRRARRLSRGAGTTPTAALTAGDLDLTVLRQHLMPCDINMSISLPQARHGLVVDYAWLDFVFKDGSSLELVGRRGHLSQGRQSG